MNAIMTLAEDMRDCRACAEYAANGGVCDGGRNGHGGASGCRWFRPPCNSQGQIDPVTGDIIAGDDTCPADPLAGHEAEPPSDAVPPLRPLRVAGAGHSEQAET